MHSSDRNQIFHIEAYYKSRDLTHDFMTMNKHDRLIYKKKTINLLKLLNDQLISRLADEKKIMLIIDKFEFIFSDNKLIFSNICKRIDAK